MRHFLEQCLHSVHRAIPGIDAEVWVVDNASADDSIAFLQPRFGWVNFIINTANVGFGKANNQALALSSGQYVLFLNPDTLLPEDSLQKCIAFMDAQPKAGALGIRMLDGSGNFLPESKRSFPSPMASFYKLTGLSSIFPKSGVFGKYALGYFSEFKNHEVDVLAGAFMLVRTEVAKQLNGFDEAFFMYGEDIDLSYRIQQAGYKNYYFSESSIVHFKGESTRKGSLNYVKMFYHAMSLFVRKHYGSQRSKIFNIVINIAIWLRATVTLVQSAVTRFKNPLLDQGCIILAFLLVWFVRNQDLNLTANIATDLPAFCITYLVFAILAGSYKGRYTQRKVLVTALLTIVTLLLLNIVRPPVNRISSLVLLASGGLATLFLVLKQSLIISNKRPPHRNILVAGNHADLLKVKALYDNLKIKNQFVENVELGNNFQENLTTIQALMAKNSVTEMVFCTGTVTYAMAIEIIQALPKTRFRFYASGSHSIVGSDSKNSAGEIIADPNNSQTVNY